MPLVYAEPASLSSPTPDLSEFDSVISEIRAMVKTDEREVPNFVVREATPERIEKLFRTPGVVHLPRNIRENGLIFAGLGSDLLSFDKPSDIIAKVSSWFPVEVANARENKNQRFGPPYLYGPYEHWNAEPAAFMSLWNCMPQNAWLRPNENPFSRRWGDGRNPLYPIAARSSSYEEYDFGLCIHKRNGALNKWNPEDEKQPQKIAEMVAPLLRSRFASFLSNSRCRGTGPDDCVLIMRLWASLSPSDPDLAATIQSLETDVVPDAPLPELINPKASWSDSKLEDGQARFDVGLRRAAFLRAKLLSVLNAPHAWPDDALSVTLRQLSTLRRDFAFPYVRRFYMYEIDYRNDPINPWRIVDSELSEKQGLRLAILNELERLSLSNSAECEVFDQWFKHGGKSLQTEYVLRRLRSTGKKPECGSPDFEWLRQQTDSEYRYVLYGYLALMDYLPETEKSMLAAGLTNDGALCGDKNETALPSWLRQICAKSRSGKFLLRKEMD